MKSFIFGTVPVKIPRSEDSKGGLRVSENGVSIPTSAPPANPASNPSADEAIRLHDKLLLILSPDSMNSEWVKTEIRKARKREVKDNRRMLFPVIGWTKNKCRQQQQQLTNYISASRKCFRTMPPLSCAFKAQHLFQRSLPNKQQLKA